MQAVGHTGVGLFLVLPTTGTAGMIGIPVLVVTAIAFAYAFFLLLERSYPRRPGPRG